MDWSIEVQTSLNWLFKAYSITLLVAFFLGAILVRFSSWGRQFWRISGEYFHPKKSGWIPLLSISGILFLTLAGVRLSVLFSGWSNQMYTSLQKADEPSFWFSMWLFCILASAHVVRELASFFARNAFTIHWREWLNHRLLARWLEHQSYYRTLHLPQAPDNPDQRIQQDVVSFAERSLALSMGVINAFVSMIEFTVMLWGLSGVLPLFGIEIPRGMVFVVYVYVLVATFFAFRIGRPLVRLNFLQEKLAADYRYALVRVREYAESIAFYRGEAVESQTLLQRFALSIKNAWAIVYRYLKFSGFNFVIGQTSVVFPFLIQAKRFFSKQISLGDLIQTARAFQTLEDNLSFFRSSYDDFSGYRAVLDRLTGFLDALDASQKLTGPKLQVGGAQVVAHALTVRTPIGGVLIQDAAFTVGPRQSLLVRGPSGSGKTTLLRALAGIWPYAEGALDRPEQALFLSQKPYLPLGTLRAALHYPSRVDGGSIETEAEVLRSVQLGHLVGQLEVEADWSRILSLGEQQRLAFGRLLLAQPQAAFLDEATSAMDEGLEDALYRLIREKLPETALISVGHRSTLLVHHQKRLDLKGRGGWELQ